MRSEPEGRSSLFLWGAVLLLALLLPFSLPGFRTFQLTVVVAYAMAVVGLNILMGHAGQISLGQGAFVAIGGYTSAILRMRLGLPFEATLPAAALAGATFACLIGIPALRLRRFHLAVVTFLMALALPSVISRLDFLTGGSQGISLTRVRAPQGLGLTPDQWLYLLATLTAVLLFAGGRLILRGRTGRAFRAIRDNEAAATSFGVGGGYNKTLAFALSGLFAGASGAVLVGANGFVAPGSFDLPFSIALLSASVIGGLESIPGGVAGAAFIYFLPLFVLQWTGGLGVARTSGIPAIAYGALLILVMFAAPGGLAALIRAGYDTLRRLREMAAALGPD